MSGYQYEATKAERRAAVLLRKKGWRVDEPACPQCHGNGFIWNVEASGGTASTLPCPRGCSTPMMFFPAQSSHSVLDGVPCTCPRGNYTGDWICGRHNPRTTTTGTLST